MNSETNKQKLEQRPDDITIVTAKADAEENTATQAVAKAAPAATPKLVSQIQNSSRELHDSEGQAKQSVIKQEQNPQIKERQIDLPKIHAKKSLAHHCVLAWIVFVISSVSIATVQSFFTPGPMPYLMPTAAGVFAGYLIIPVLIFLPMILAGFRKSSKSNLVVLLNTLLGWSVVGWAAALWIALKSPTKEDHRISSAYRNAVIALIGICALTCLGYIPGWGAISSVGIFAAIFDPIQSWLAVITQQRLKEKNPALAYLGPIQAWVGANIGTLTTTGIMVAVIAQVINTLFLRTQSLDKTSVILALAFSTWLVVATLLIQTFGIGLYYYRLSKDLEDATTKRETGIPYRCLLTGLGPALSVLWIALNSGADNWFQHFGTAVALGQLWSMSFMYFAVRDWENKAAAGVLNTNSESISKDSKIQLE